MQHTIVIDQKEFVYTLKRRRYQRRVNMIVHQDGSLVVTAPKLFSLGKIEKVLIRHAPWLQKHVGESADVYVTIDPMVVSHIKKALRQVVHEKLKYFNAHYHFSYNRVAIRAQSTVWGSCSAKKNLNFNYKIFCLPQKLQNYIIVHELCHLKELNHSRDFWDLVAQQVPGYKACKKELRIKKM